MVNPMRKLTEAGKRQREWVKANPKASTSARIKRSLVSVKEATGIDLQFTPGKMLSMFVPVPVKDADRIDKKVRAIDAKLDRKLKR